MTYYTKHKLSCIKQQVLKTIEKYDDSWVNATTYTFKGCIEMFTHSIKRYIVSRFTANVHRTIVYHVVDHARAPPPCNSCDINFCIMAAYVKPLADTGNKSNCLTRSDVTGRTVNFRGRMVRGNSRCFEGTCNEPCFAIAQSSNRKPLFER